MQAMWEIASKVSVATGKVHIFVSVSPLFLFGITHLP